MRTGSDKTRRQQIESNLRERVACALATQAYERLLDLAERQDTTQARTVARFLASTFDGRNFPLDPFDLRSVDTPVSNDMLQCLDALRWGRVDLHALIPDGRARVTAVCARRDLARANGPRAPRALAKD
jgi:hypothetical protein